MTPVADWVSSLTQKRTRLRLIRKMHHQNAVISSPDGTPARFHAGRPAVAGPFGVRGCDRCDEQSQRRLRSKPRGATTESPSPGADTSSLRSDTLRDAMPWVDRCPEHLGRSLLAGGVDNRNPPSVAYVLPAPLSTTAAGESDTDVDRRNSPVLTQGRLHASPVSAYRAVRRRGKRKSRAWRAGLDRCSVALHAPLE